jgi:hypothetical protein
MSEKKKDPKKIGSFGETVLYEEKTEVPMQSKGKMKSKEAVRNNYDDGETQILERDLSNTLDM